MRKLILLAALLAMALPAVAAEATSYEDLQVFDTIVCDVVIVKDYIRGNSNFFRVADDADGDVTFTVESGLTFASGDSSAIDFGASALTIASAAIAGDVTGIDSLFVTDLDVSNNAVIDGTLSAEDVASTDDASVADSLDVGGNAKIDGRLNVDGTVQGAGFNFCAAANVTGGADSIVVDYTPDLTLQAGLVVTFVAEAANTGAATLVLDGVEDSIVEGSDGSALEAGDIPNGGAVMLMFDGTDWQQLSQSGN